MEPQWLWAKADWDLFAIEMNKHLITETKFILDQKECDNMVNHLYNTIEKAHVSRFTTIHHLKAEIESFKMVCNTSLGLFFGRNEGITYMWYSNNN